MSKYGLLIKDCEPAGQVVEGAVDGIDIRNALAVERTRLAAE
jgi:hypothetical protein